MAKPAHVFDSFKSSLSALSLYLHFRLSNLHHMISLLVSTASHRFPNIKYRLCKVQKINIDIVCVVDLV